MSKTISDKDILTHRTQAAYGWFESEAGKLVMSDLEKAFGFSHQAFVADANGAYCPIKAALRDGQRSVLLHLKALSTKYSNGETQKKPDPIR